MSIWERLSAAARDFSAKAPVGSLLRFEGAGEGRKPLRADDNEVPFTVGVIVLGAKMARADGTIAADEVKAFKEAFKVSPAEMKHAAPIFNSAKRDAANFEAHAEQLVVLFNGNRRLLEHVLDGLFHIAKADAEVRPEEERFLGEVAKRFGFTVEEINSIKARHMVAAKRNPYAVLGVEPSIGDEQLERHYRQLVADNDPGEFVARGVPKEFVVIAIEKQAALEDAYEAIRKERAR
jgi:DnaJ like chaperone protein